MNLMAVGLSYLTCVKSVEALLLDLGIPSNELPLSILGKNQPVNSPQMCYSSLGHIGIG